ncbi:MAG: hypothetical protein IH804_09950, partial [Planctomycetes bacterium]|nr:hypothetical protein [Planctomycetota bacterium]
MGIEDDRRQRRVGQIERLANVSVYLDSELTAEDALAFGAERVVLMIGWHLLGVGAGRPGRGRGGRAPEEKTGERWVKRRTPIITTRGAIIGKMFIDGEQVSGEVSSEAVELFSAAQREATDALEKNRIPNQYRGAVKDYCFA